MSHKDLWRKIYRDHTQYAHSVQRKFCNCGVVARNPACANMVFYYKMENLEEVDLWQAVWDTFYRILVEEVIRKHPEWAMEAYLC